MASKCMRFTRVSVSVKTTSVFSVVRRNNARFTRVSASLKTAFAFSLVLLHNVCVPHACLHRLRRLLRSSSYRVTMHAFNTRVCVG